MKRKKIYDITKLYDEPKKSKVETRLNKIYDWVSNPYNLALIAIILFALGVRLYFITITADQPLWWDEAEYMLKAKNIAFGTPETGWAGDIRPLGLPILAALLFKVGLGEILIRFTWIFISVLNIYLIYLIGKNSFNKETGLIGAFIFSILYLDIFYVTRLLVDVPQIFFITLSVYLFTKVYFDNGDKRLIYLILPVIFLGTLFRFTVGLLIPVLLLFLFSVKNVRLLKEKEWYISSVLGILTFLPYMIYSQIKFGNPLSAIIYVLFTGEGQRAPNPLKVLMDYIVYFPKYNHIFLFIFFLIGLSMIIFFAFIGYDTIKSNKKTQRNILLLLLIIIPLLFFGLYINHFEDRYIMMIFPFVSIITAHAIVTLYHFGCKYNRFITILILTVLLAIACHSDLKKVDELIKSKVDSYKDFKIGGEWIKNNSNLQDVVYSTGQPQLTYYSERPTFSFPSDMNTFLENITIEKENYRVRRYYVVSVWEQSPQWVYQHFSNNSDYIPVQVYYQNGQISTAILVDK